MVRTGTVRRCESAAFMLLAVSPTEARRELALPRTGPFPPSGGLESADLSGRIDRVGEPSPSKNGLGGFCTAIKLKNNLPRKLGGRRSTGNEHQPKGILPERGVSKTNSSPFFTPNHMSR